MPTYQRNIQVEAVQWDGVSPIPGAITLPEQAKNWEIKQIVAQGKAVMRLHDELKVINPNDWVVKGQDGIQIYNNAEFQNTFIPQ